MALVMPEEEMSKAIYLAPRLYHAFESWAEVAIAPLRPGNLLSMTERLSLIPDFAHCPISRCTDGGIQLLLSLTLAPFTPLNSDKATAEANLLKEI